MTLRSHSACPRCTFSLSRPLLLVRTLSVFFTLLTLSIGTTAAAQDETVLAAVCDLPCQNGGACREGQSPAVAGHSLGDDGLQPLIPLPAGDGSREADHHHHHQQDQHCECQEGWTGQHCEVPFTRCTGPNDQHPDEQYVCYHGGTCFGGEDSDAASAVGHGKPQIYHHPSLPQLCDCRTAFDPVAGLEYVGRFCEHPSVDTCDPNEEGPKLCVNGGTCESHP